MKNEIEFQIGDYIETSEYYGKIVSFDVVYEIKVLLIKSDSMYTWEDFLSQDVDTGIKSFYDNVHTDDMKLLSVPWKSFVSLLKVLRG